MCQSVCAGFILFFFIFFHLLTPFLKVVQLLSNPELYVHNMFRRLQFIKIGREKILNLFFMKKIKLVVDLTAIKIKDRKYHKIQYSQQATSI